jgi:hypothetical protein
MLFCRSPNISEKQLLQVNPTLAYCERSALSPSLIFIEAEAMPPSSSLSLRTLSHLITTTPADILPQTTPYLLSILNNCGTILSATDSHATGKEATDSSILVHKYIVQLSALLHGKSFQARWTAVALIKATIELGGWEILRNSGAWVRGLLGILAVPESSILVALILMLSEGMYRNRIRQPRMA